MGTPGLSASVRTQMLRTAFCLSFSVHKAASAYNEHLAGSAPAPLRIPIIFIIVPLSVLTAILTAIMARPVYGIVVLIAPYLAFVLFNFIVTWIILDSFQVFSLQIAKRYIDCCLIHQIQLNIPFVIYLRPFAVDSSLRLNLFDPMDWLEEGGKITGFAYHNGRPILSSINNVDLINCVQLLTEKIGVVWIQAGIIDCIESNRIIIKFKDNEWKEQIQQLCEAARFIVFLPLFDVDLETNIEFAHSPPPEIAALLKKRDHDGLEIEMHLLTKPTIVSKSIFMVPGVLSVRERDAIRRKMGDHGLILGEDVPYITENHVRLYRSRTKGEAMRAVEIGAYLGRSFNEGLGTNEFSPVTSSCRNSWFRVYGNAIEYLLEDDVAEQNIRWPTKGPYPKRARPRERLEDGGPYVL